MWSWPLFPFFSHPCSVSSLVWVSHIVIGLVIIFCQACVWYFSSNVYIIVKSTSRTSVLDALLRWCQFSRRSASVLEGSCMRLGHSSSSARAFCCCFFNILATDFVPSQCTVQARFFNGSFTQSGPITIILDCLTSVFQLSFPHMLGSHIGHALVFENPPQ